MAASARFRPCLARGRHVRACGSETQSGNVRGECSRSRRRTKARLDKWIQNGRILQASVCVKPHVACTVRSVRRAQEAGYGRSEHMCSRGEPLEMRGLLSDVQSDVMAARVVGIRQEGLNPCRMVPSETGRGARSANSCHDVTGKVQGARAVNCRAGAQVANCRAGAAQ